MHTNRLASEKSPYLLQHAHNPVDWYPWGPEAFEKGAPRRQAHLPFHRLLDVPLVPRHGARVVRKRAHRRDSLNRDYVPIKVDREERPDVDRIYMTFVQATTGGGGWPMSVWLTPDLRAVLRRHVFSAREPLRPSRLRLHPGPDRRGLAPPIAARSWIRRATWSSNFSSTWRSRPGGAGAIDARSWTAASSLSAARSMRSWAASAARPSFRGPRCYNFLLRYLRAHARTGSRSTWCCSRCAKWPRAACTISSAAAFTATRWTSAGSCRTSRRCSTTRRNSPSRTWKLFRSPATRNTPTTARRTSITCCAT